MLLNLSIFNSVFYFGNFLIVYLYYIPYDTKFWWEKILTNLTNFQKFVSIFPTKIFHLVSYLLLMNLWQSGSTIYINEAPSLENHNIQSSLTLHNNYQHLILHSVYDGSGRPLELSLALFTGWKYFNNDMAEESHHMINNTGTWLTKAWNRESLTIPWCCWCPLLSMVISE